VAGNQRRTRNLATITGGAFLPILTRRSNLRRSWQRSATVAKSINLDTYAPLS
jgi:hypothetical protein